MNNREKKILISSSRANIVEIDYEKLAEALVKAEEKYNEIKSGAKDINEKQGLLKSIISILKGKRSKDGSLSYAPFAVVIIALYKTIAITGGILLVPFIMGCLNYCASMQWSGSMMFTNLITIVIMIIAFVFILLYMLMFWGAANDMEYEKDKEYVINVFTGLVSIAALTISIIKLY